METDMLGMAAHALTLIFDPMRLGFLFFGVLIGLVVGVIPGLGGLVGLSLLLPFTFDMDPYTALAFMIGLQSVTATGDTIPAVLFGVPGTVASAATIMDGYPMAKKGEAGRALGASYTSNVMGGLFGALLLGVSIPILRPIMLYIGSPELLAFCIFGISLVAVLSGSSVLKGMIGALLGVLVATTGDDPQTGTLRWTFDSLYLWDGLPIVPLALGLFAIPELADLAIAKKSIYAGGERFSATKGQWQGTRDAFKHWFLVLRSSLIGAGLGAVPGLGASVIDWVAYGHALRTEKGARDTFTKGDIRGVIASEASNNAKEGGALVPTIAFGVPGSASMALILGVFLIQGIVPGPDMVTKRLDITYTLVWSVAIANILGAGICFMFANQFAKLALLRPSILIPTVLAVTFVGAFQGSRAWGDLYTLLLFGLLGWVMKRYKWPRPPLILGFVLGSLIERNMFISVERYGASWLLHPIVAGVLLITIYGLVWPVTREWLERRKVPAERRPPPRRIAFQRQKLDSALVFALLFGAVFIAALIESSGWEFGAKLVPQVISWAALFFLVLYLLSELFLTPAIPVGKAGAEGGEIAGQQGMHFDLSSDFGDLDDRSVVRRAVEYFAWCAFYVVVAWVIGLLPALLVFMVCYMRFHGKESWALTLKIAVPIWVACYILFHHILIVPWPQTLLGDWFPGLRSIFWLNMF